MKKIGVILPSRGLSFARAEDALSKNLEGYNYKIYRSWDLPIPDCENVLVEKALQEGCDYLFFVEDDTVMPDFALRDLLQIDSDIACIDYAVNGYSCITKDKNTKEILWCGLGCTLVKAKVFASLEKPYFRSDKALLLNYWPEERWIDAGWQAYGGQDIWFCMQARRRGFLIKQVPGECQHLKLDALGQREINNGIHQISQKPVISQYMEI